MVLEARTQPLRALPLGNLMRILRLIQYDTMGMLFTGLFIDGDKGQVAVHGQLPGEFIRDLYMDHQAGGAGVDDAAGKSDHGAVAYRGAERHTVDIAADDLQLWNDYFYQERKKVFDLNADIAHAEYEIDHVVYELFGVTRDEIDLIERL